MSNSVLQLRMYDPAQDHPMIMQWCEAHGHVGIPANILPKLGVVVQADGKDIAALWLYMDNSTGVCFVEHPIAKAGIDLKLARAAFSCALEYLKKEARTWNYWIMRCFTKPAIARILQKSGFRKDADGLVAMACPLLENNHGD